MGEPRTLVIPDNLNLPNTFKVLRPSIVALGSKLARTINGQPPAFPRIIGTGFIVDERGIVATNRHVAEELLQLRHPQTGVTAAFAMLSAEVEHESCEHFLATHLVEILTYNFINSFSTDGDFYGEPIPDLAFIQLNVKNVPKVHLATDSNTLQIGIPIATAGFSLGREAMVLQGRIVHATPLLRHGIVSSLYPFPCPNPHGFTTDVTIQGGASGSPIFLLHEPLVVGMMFGGYGFGVVGVDRVIDTNISIALSSKLIADGINSTLNDIDTLDLSHVPTLESLGDEAETHNKPSWDFFQGQKRITR